MKNDRWWDASRGRTLSETVVFEVARLEGVDPLDLPPLFGVIDPEALDGLFSARTISDPEGTTDAPLTVEFVYAGYRIAVWRDGSFLVERLEGPTDSDSRGELRVEAVSSERLYGSEPSPPE